MQASNKSSAPTANATPKAPEEAPLGANLEWGRILLFVAIVVPLLVAVILHDRCG